MTKFWLTLLASGLVATTGLAEGSDPFGVVNFSSCVLDSKFGKREQQSFENIRQQMTNVITDTEKEIQELAARFEDTEYLDSLSPKAEEELKNRMQTLNEDLGRYQGQFYQVMQQAQMHLVQKVQSQIAKAAEQIAQQHKFDYVINRDTCFYYRPSLDVTDQVIQAMDRNFEKESHTSDSGVSSEDSHG